MFKEHQSKIGAWARAHPDNFGRVLQFVILTIRAPLYNIRADIETAQAGGPAAMSVLFGFKAQAYAEAWAKRETALSFCEHVLADPDLTPREQDMAMLEHIADMAGFGPVKAGFVLQLAFGRCGCLDTHNLIRLGVPMRAFGNYKMRKTTKGRRAMLSHYVSHVYRLGGPEKLWDGWCDYVARKYPAIYTDADHVSRLHCEALDVA
jgi:hypothetical protein